VKQWLLVAGLMGVTAWAGLGELTGKETLALKRTVARDIGNLVADTVNEGETEAHVRVRGPERIPEVSCFRKQLPGRDTSLLFCKVDSKVRPYLGDWETRQCSLTYVLYEKKPFPTIARAKGPTFDRCLELLSEG
jgi:hypothetical protein